MAPDLKRTKYASTAVHSLAFEGANIGRLWVQFQKGELNLTTLGYYDDVPRQLFNMLHISRKPGKMIAEQLKEHFTWTHVSTQHQAEIKAGTPQDFVSAALDADPDAQPTWRPLGIDDENARSAQVLEAFQTAKGPIEGGPILSSGRVLDETFIPKQVENTAEAIRKHYNEAYPGKFDKDGNQKGLF